MKYKNRLQMQAGNYMFILNRKKVSRTDNTSEMILVYFTVYFRLIVYFGAV